MSEEREVTISISRTDYNGPVEISFHRRIDEVMSNGFATSLSSAEASALGRICGLMAEGQVLTAKVEIGKKK